MSFRISLFLFLFIQLSFKHTWNWAIAEDGVEFCQSIPLLDLTQPHGDVNSPKKQELYSIDLNTLSVQRHTTMVFIQWRTCPS